MSILIDENCSNFFQIFNANLVKEQASSETTLLFYHSRHGFGLQAKNSPWYQRLIRWLNPFITTDIKTIEDKLHNLVTRRRDHQRIFYTAEEMIAMSKSCNYLARLFGHVKQRREAQGHEGVARLQAAMAYFKNQRLQAIYLAASLKNKSPLVVACESYLLDEAMQLDFADKEFRLVAPYFPALLQRAHANGDNRFLLRLLENGADAGRLPIGNEELLKMAIENRSEKVFAAILGPDPNNQNFAKVLQSYVEPSGQRSALECAKTAKFFCRVAACKEKFSTLPYQLLQQHGAQVKESAFVLALRGDFWDEVLKFSVPKDVLMTLKKDVGDRRALWNLLQLAEREGKNDLLYDLVSIDIDHAQLLHATVLACFERAVETKDRETALLLLGSQSHQVTLIKDLQAKIKRAPVMTADELVAHREKCRTLQRLVKEALKNRSTAALNELQKYCSVERLESIKQAAKLTKQSALLFALKAHFFKEAVDLKPTKEALKEASSLIQPLVLKAYNKKQMGLLFDLIALGGQVATLPVNADWLLPRAIEQYNDDACVQLMQQGASHNTLFTTNDSDYKGSSLLHVASVWGLQKFASLLLQKGLAVNLPDENGNIPLHLAKGRAGYEMYLFLLGKGGDPSKKNNAGRLPLPRTYEFYQELFAGLDVLLQVLRFDRAPIDSAKGIFDELKGQSRNPLEIAFLLQDIPLAKKFASFLTKYEFASYIESLQKQFPTVDLCPIEYCPYGVDSEHYKRGIFDFKVEKPQSNVDLAGLKIALVDLSRDEQRRYKAHLKMTIDKIKNKTVFDGTPRADPALSEYYEVVKFAWQNILLKLQEYKRNRSGKYIPMLKEVMEQMARAAPLCGGQLRSTSVGLYLKYCKDFVLTAEEEFYKSLADDRLILSESLFARDPHGVHGWNLFAKKRGQKLGLRGWQIAAQFKDPYIGDRSNMDEVEVDFLNQYTPHNIGEEYLKPKMAEIETIRNYFFDWHKNHVPKLWQQDHFNEIIAAVRKMQSESTDRHRIVEFLGQKDIVLEANESYEVAIEKERKASYMGTWVVDMETGRAKKAALLDFLVGTKVLTSCFVADKPSGYFTGLLAYIPGSSYFSKLRTWWSG